MSNLLWYYTFSLAIAHAVYVYGILRSGETRVTAWVWFLNQVRFAQLNVPLCFTIPSLSSPSVSDPQAQSCKHDAVFLKRLYKSDVQP